MSQMSPCSRPQAASSPALRLALAPALPALACFTHLGPQYTGTDAAATTSASTPTTGGPEPLTEATTGLASVCGDGVEQPGEACDLGPLNDDYGACTRECALAVCGDGLLAPA